MKLLLSLFCLRCEKALMASVNVKNCVKFYTTADEIGAHTLKEHCSSLISAHWVSEDYNYQFWYFYFKVYKDNLYIFLIF